MKYLMKSTFLLFFASVIINTEQSQTTYLFAQQQVDTHLNLEAPKDKAEVHYGSQIVDFGNEIYPDAARQQPTQIIWPYANDILYTLMLIDLDAPSRKDPSAREWRHWVIVNIPKNDVAKGNTLTKYEGPSPPSGSGLHRYVFLVFQQNDRINSNEKLGDRNNFKAREFANKHNLKAIAGNYFQAKTS